MMITKLIAIPFSSEINFGQTRHRNLNEKQVIANIAMFANVTGVTRNDVWVRHGEWDVACRL